MVRPSLPRRDPHNPLPLVCAVLATTLAARLGLLAGWGGPVPLSDQWEADALQLYRPWLEGALRWTDFLAAHNEHRPALTRLISLGLFLAKSQVWPVWEQLWLNATLHAACAGLLARFLLPRLETSRARFAFAAGLALVFAAPAGWQNALWGFQSQVYLASLLSILAIAGLTTDPPFGRAWWFGGGAALLALFTQGSGLFAAAVPLAFLATDALREKTHDARRRLILAAAVPAGLVCLGLALRVEQPAHASLFARDFAQFWAVFTRCLGWPWVDSPFAWLILQSPLVLLLLIRRRARRPFSVGDRLALALGLLTLLHAAAVAYTRAGGLAEARPLSRYQDPLLPGVAAQLYALLALAAPIAPRFRIFALGWTAVGAAGLLTLTTANLALNLPFKRLQQKVSLAAVRSYLATGNAAMLDFAITELAPHPDPAVLRSALDDPRLRPCLPPELFPPPGFQPVLPPRPPAESAPPSPDSPWSTPPRPSSLP